MRDESSSGTADDSALLAGSKKLDDLKNALESSKEGQQLEAMKKVIGYIAKGTVHFYFVRKLSDKTYGNVKRNVESVM